MSIRGRVGRHNKTGGRHCQNWIDDQKEIVRLLNSIAEDQGGTAGKLNPRFIGGMAAEDLFKAILKFEQKYFPGQNSGFVDPGGRMLQKMEMLAASKPAPAANAPEPESSKIDLLLEDAESIVGDPNYSQVHGFLKRLKSEGYSQPIQNERILFYGFGVFKFVKGNNTGLPERHHIATPLFKGDMIKPGKNAKIIFVGNNSLVSISKGKPRHITRVTVGQVILETPDGTEGPAAGDQPMVSIGQVILEEPGVTFGPIVIEE